MAKRIEKLTPEQEAQIPIIRDEFLRIGLSTEPADFDAAEQAVKDAYAVAGLEPPKLFIRLASPHEGAIGAAILKDTHFGASVWAQVGDQVGAQVRDQVWDQVRAQVWDQVRAQVGAQVWAQVWDQVGDQVGDQVRAQVWDQVGDQVGDQVRAQVRAQVGDQVWAQVWDQVRAQVWDQVRAQVWDQVRAQVGDQVRAAYWSQHEAGWLSFHHFFAHAVDLENAKRLEPLTRIARNCGWVWFFAGAVIMTDRPRVLRRDDQNRLHCEDGPALEYRDGFAIHAWHGTRVPAEWITDKDKLTAKVALTWENIEQRRAACEILGWDLILRELNAHTIDADADPEVGELLEVEIPEIGREKFLRVRCGTGRQFALPVPPDMQTALEANAWTYGFDAKTFLKPEIRT